MQHAAVIVDGMKRPIHAAEKEETKYTNNK